MISRPLLLLPALLLAPALVAQPRSDVASLPAAATPFREPVRFEHLTEREGLSQGCAYAIYQDSRGFLWIGTQDGLNRYDGYDFHVYYPDPFDSTTLASGWIMDVDEGTGGILWIGADGALSRFDPASERFTNYTNDPAEPTSLLPGTVTSVVEDRLGGVWVGMQEGLSYMPADTPGSLIHFRHDRNDPTSLSGENVFQVFEDASGRIWVATSNGLNRVSRPAQDGFVRYLNDSTRTGRPGSDRWSVILSITQLAGELDVLWLGTYHGLVRFDVATGAAQRFVPDADAAPVFTDLEPDREDPRVLWVGGQGGFFRFDTRTSTFSPVRGDPADPGSLPGDEVSAIHADRTGSVWVSASCGGLSRFNTTAARFTLIRGVSGDESRLEAVGAGAVDDAGTVWVGARTSSGTAVLNRIDRATGEVRRREFQDGYVRAMLVDDAGGVWVAHRGVIHLDDALRTIRHFAYDPADSTKLDSEVVTSLLEDRDGRLWAGTPWGLELIDRQTGRVSHFHFDETVSGGPTRYESKIVSTLYQSLDGTIWAGTHEALFQFDPITGTFTRRLPDSGARLDGGPYRWIHERAREPGVLWLAGSGLTRFDTRTSTATHFRTRDGLPNNTVYAILEDDTGNLWLSTNRGLSRFAPETARFTNFGLEHGLQGLEFNEGAAFRSPDGELYFGGLRGLTAFRPEEVTHNPVPPSVVLTDLRLFNEPVAVGPDAPLKQTLDETAGVQLRHDQNHVAIDFVGLHFQNPARNAYAYILEGFDPNWIDAGARREATYANLPPGDYTFRVRAANSDGVWSEARELNLTILPPWWRTWWAYAIYGLMLGALMLVVHRAQRARVLRRERERVQERELAHAREIERANRELEARNNRLRQNEEQLESQNRQLERQNEWIEEQNRKLRELDEVKSRFFANISHEFRTPLTLILGPLNNALRNGRTLGTDDVPAMRRSARRLLRLINQLLDLSRIDAGAMQLQRKTTDVGLLLKRLVGAFSSLAERKGVALVYDGPAAAEIVGAVDPEKLEQIATNLVSNAIKFTSRNGKVRLALRALDPAPGTSERIAEIVVEDTGRGIAPENLPLIFDRFYQADSSATREQEGTGIGLALTRELVELHGGTISAESKPGFGTSFTMRIPLPTGADTAPEGAGEPEDRADATDAETAAVSGDGWGGNETSAASASGDAARKRGTVLVVEDNPDMRAYLERMLVREGYAVETASDGEEGRDRALALVPDLVIADVMMPRMDGFQLCRALKEDERLAAVPVVLLTARAAEADRLEGLGAGADDYLAKPFDADELMVRVENLIEIRRRLRDRFSRHVRLGPEEISVASADATFVEEIRRTIEENMSDSRFGVEAVAEAVGLSPRQLHRRIKDLTGLTPGGYIRMMRLERAEQLLRQRAGQVAEVAYAVGFNDPKYFSRLFRQTYGCTPSEYAVTDLT